MATNRDELIVQQLVKMGRLGAAQVAQAQSIAQEKNINLVMALIQSGFLSATDIAEAAEVIEASGVLQGKINTPAPQISEPSVPVATPPAEPRSTRSRKTSLANYQIDTEALRDIPRLIAEEYNVLPLQISEDQILVAMSDKDNVFALDAIRTRTRRRVEAVEVDAAELTAAIARFYDQHAQQQISAAATAKDLSGSLSGMEDLGGSLDRALLDMLDQGQVIEIVRAILRDAIRMRASDIHIEPRVDHTQVRYRVDGRLATHTTLPEDMHRYVISRIKILAECDISETRLPQDGRFATTIDNIVIDLRVSTLPTFWGEKVVLRLLDRSRTLVALTQLGFSPEMLVDYERLIRMPQGMILVTGPTGSGKSTTLYASLHAINDETRNITTVEDPIEYEVSGINQTQVHPRIDLSFARALRHILRQDPDVILVGEVRDLETAEMAFRAALTGHLVLTTLHTNDAPSALMRLADMGIAPYIPATSITGVLAQRLVRRICPRCRETYRPAENEIARLELSQEKAARIQFHRGRGCQNCHNTGHTGRVALYELMVMTPELRDAVSAGASASELRHIALRSGMKTLRYDGLLKIHQGITSAEEVSSIMSSISDE